MARARATGGRSAAKKRGRKVLRPVSRAGRRAEFRPMPGSRISKKAAREVGGVIEKLVAQGQGTPEALVAEARKKRSPAHKHFVWDEHANSENWLKHHARTYFRAIAIVIEDVSDSPVPAFERVVTESAEGDESRYEHIDTVRTNEDLMEQALDRAKTDLLVWWRRYKRYRAMAGKLGLEGVFDAVERDLIELQQDKENNGSLH